MKTRRFLCTLIAASMLTGAAVSNVYNKAEICACAEVSDDAFTQLNCVEDSSHILGAAASSDGKLALQAAESTKVYVVSEGYDEILKTYDYKIPNAELLTLTKDGTAVMADFEGNDLPEIFYKDGEEYKEGYEEVEDSFNRSENHLLYFYDEELPPKIVSLPTLKQFVSADKNGNVYFTSGNSSYIIDPESCAVHFDKLLTDYMIDDDEKGISVKLTEGSTPRALCDFSVIDKNSGRQKWSKPFYDYYPNEFLSNIRLFGDDLITYGTGKNVPYPKEPGPIRCYDIKEGEFKCCFRLPKGSTPVFSDSSSYGLVSFTEPSGESFVIFFDPADGSYCKFDTGIADISRVIGICTSNNKWVVAAGNAESSKVFVADLSKADLSEHFELIDEVSKVGSEMADIRKRADEIEKKFGVTILLGDEVNESLTGNLCSFEPYLNDTTRAEMLKNLDQLDVNMSKYPEGFFEKFKEKNGKKGYLIYLTFEYNSDGSLHNWLGYNTVINGWYIVAGSREFVDGWGFFHETFHAVENLVSSKYPIDDKEWAALNPEDYEPFDFWDPRNADKIVERYIVGMGEDPYFITDAAMGAPHEDRAIIMGQLCSKEDKVNFDADFEDRYEYIKTNYPHIYKKIEYMAKWVYQYYGYVYWTSVLGLPDNEYDYLFTDDPRTGDVNFDNKTDIEDVVIIINHINGVSRLTEKQIYNADVDRSKKVDIEDAVRIINHINGVSPLK